MQWPVFVFCLIILCGSSKCEPSRRRAEVDFGSHLVTQMKDDANLDLPVDEEYEDLRAELLAYHSALASLASGVAPGSGRRNAETRRSNRRYEDPRRSLKTTPCWKLGGVCIPFKLCQGDQFQTEVPGCKNKLEVCCFGWNKFKTRFDDFKKIGIRNMLYPWNNVDVVPFVGKGVIPVSPHGRKKKHHSNLQKLYGPFNDDDDDESDEESPIARTKHKSLRRDPSTALAVVLRPIY